MIFTTQCLGQVDKTTVTKTKINLQIFNRPAEFLIQLYKCKAESTSTIFQGDTKHKDIEISHHDCKLMHSLLNYEHFSIKPNATTVDVIYQKNENFIQIKTIVTIHDHTVLIQSDNGLIPGINDCNYIYKTCIGNDGERVFWEEIIKLDNYSLLYEGQAEQIIIEQNTVKSTMFNIKFNEKNVNIAIGALWAIDEECNFQSDHQNLIIRICDDKSTKFKISDKNLTSYIESDCTTRTFYIVGQNNSIIDAIFLNSVLSDELDVPSTAEYENLIDICKYIILNAFICLNLFSFLIMFKFMRRVRQPRQASIFKVAIYGKRTSDV